MGASTSAEFARCVLLFNETNSAAIVQHRFCNENGKQPPSRPTNYSWHNNFTESDCSVGHVKSPGQPCVSNAVVKQVKESFALSP